jgi:shikimate kinase
MAVLLLGFDEVAKAEIGRGVAEKKHLHFIDLAQALIDALGMPVDTYIAEHGEDAYLKVETRIFNKSMASMHVVAVPERTVLNPGTYPYFSLNYTTFYLSTAQRQDASLERMFNRLSAWEVTTDGKSTAEVVKQVL